MESMTRGDRNDCTKVGQGVAFPRWGATSAHQQPSIAACVRRCDSSGGRGLRGPDPYHRSFQAFGDGSTRRVSLDRPREVAGHPIAEELAGFARKPDYPLFDVVRL